MLISGQKPTSRRAIDVPLQSLLRFVLLLPQRTEKMKNRTAYSWMRKYRRRAWISAMAIAQSAQRSQCSGEDLFRWL